VVHVPHGAHPTSCYGYYDYDAPHLNAYRALASNDQKFSEYLREYVIEAADHDAYLTKIGHEALDRIRAASPYGYRPGLQRGAVE
jgi:glutaconate CoA-transferase subunit A